MVTKQKLLDISDLKSTTKYKKKMQMMRPSRITTDRDIEAPSSPRPPRSPGSPNSPKSPMQMYRPSRMADRYTGEPGSPGSPRASNKYSKLVHANRGPSSPQSIESRSDDVLAQLRSAELRSAEHEQRMGPLREKRRAPKVADPTSHSMRSTMAVRGPRDLSPSISGRGNAVRQSIVASSERALSPTTRVSPKKATSPRKMRSQISTKKPESTRSSKAKKPSRSKSRSKTKPSQSSRKMKSEPLLAQDKQRAKANPTSKSKSLRQTAYKPPALDSTDDDESNLRGLTSPQAVAKAKQKARSNTRRRHEQEAISTDRYGSHKDRYGLRQDRYKVEEEDSSVFQSMEESDAADGAAYKSMEGSDGVYHEGLFTDSGTRGSTRGFTSGSDTNGDTADDTLGTYSQEEAKDSHRGMLKYRFSSLSENTSIEEGSVIIKQQVAWGCIGLSAVQFAILTTQVLLCGFAYASINPMLGPYPDAFSEWGGKNTYLLVEDGQYWRYITPTFLHVGYLHLMVNVFFQLETCAYFEREWGFFPWLFIYLCSGLGATLAASAIDPNLIGVCSSGALMGFFGARIAQAITWTAFETKVDYQGQGGVIFERLGGTVCSAAVVFFLTFLTYIDWSGHLGGLFAGFLVGFIYFAHAIQNPRTRRTVIFFAFLGLVLGGFALWAILYHIAQYDEELADACNYFRNLYREDYSCECQAFSDYD